MQVKGTSALALLFSTINLLPFVKPAHVEHFLSAAQRTQSESIEHFGKMARWQRKQDSILWDCGSVVSGVVFQWEDQLSEPRLR